MCAYVITHARHSLRPKIHSYSIWAGPNIIYMRESLSTLSKNTLKATFFFVAVVKVNIGMTFYRGARLYVEERLYTHPLFELARSDTSRVVDRNGASTRLGKTTKLFKYLWKKVHFPQPKKGGGVRFFYYLCSFYDCLWIHVCKYITYRFVYILLYMNMCVFTYHETPKPWTIKVLAN